MKRSREERFKKSVEVLRHRIGRAENFLDTQLLENKSMEKSSSRLGLDTEVYRYKNTLVEVTIHRRPNEKEPTKDEKHFSRPTSSSLTRARKSPGKKKSDNLRNNVSNSDQVGRRDKIKGARGKEKEAHYSFKEQRSIQEILGELRHIVQVSGIQDVHDFIDEFDGPAKSVNIGNPKQVKSPEKPDHSGLEAKIQQLENECQKFKAGTGRYKHEYGVMVKQVEISRDTVNSLEAQVADLKKIISRLTRNNGELLGIVSEKIHYEDLIADLEKDKAFLAKQLDDEKSCSSQLAEQLHSAETEAAFLRSLSADLRAGLRHGLAGLEMAKPASKQALPTLGDVTRNILGIKESEDVHSDTDDSAFDDPNTESLKSRSKCVQNKDKVLEKSRPLTQVLKQVPQQPVTASQVFRVNTQVPPILSFTPPTKMTTTTNPPKAPYQPTLPPPQQFSPPTSRLDLLPQRAQSRSSTLMDSPTAGKSPAFQALPLDLSETASDSSQLGLAVQSGFQVPTSSSSPPTLIPALATQGLSTKESLETKVSSFLARLHQDSLHLSLNIPQAEPYQGPSMHLSLSSSGMDQDVTRDTINTTLTEGKFLRGLETSNEVLQAELSKTSN